MSKNSSDSQMDYYYFGALNTLNGINNNALRNISFSDEGSKDIELGKTFASKDITALYLNEGDTVFEGRFGSSIRLGSNNGECENPNIVIRNGTFSEDKVFDFESFEKNKSIALFSSVDSIEIPLSKSTTDTLSDFPKIFDGEQIIINTDRAVINTNENEIIFSSNKDIGLLAKKEIGIDGEKKVHIKAKKIIIGDETRSEPIVKGEQLKMIISELIDEISNIKVSVPSAPGISGPPLNAIKLGLIKKKLSKMLSKHKVE